jgi:GT2 family glycosyltransferase
VKRLRLIAGIFTALLLALLSPIVILIPWAALLLADAWTRLTRRRRPPRDDRPRTDAASVVIPNWNGRDLLERYLPSVIEALAGNPANEIIVVDNGSSDGSAEYVRQAFPEVKVISLPENLGFGGGSNAGFREASNDIVVLLNSDMRVDPSFLQPLLEGFTDERVFAVSCQIFFSDPQKLRQETGLTQAWWSSGRLGVRHRADEHVRSLYPCFYGGGGSCAFDRRKFLELGGFDHLLRPFYLEDTDLGYMAWKRGWKVLYQPASVVYHEHRGTIGKTFNDAYIGSVLHKNFVLFAWKNIHDWRMLSSHFLYGWADVVVSLFLGESPERYTFVGFYRALRQLPEALASRRLAIALSLVDDREAFRRPLGAYFRDRFEQLEPDPERLSVLFVSPYPICPPVHGGAVFMYQTCTGLARRTDLHLLALLDWEHQRDAHDPLAAVCASAEFIVRMTGKPHSFGSVLPHAVAEFQNSDLEWMIHRKVHQDGIDVIQLEYMPLGQYAYELKQTPTMLFEHDIYFQSVARQLPSLRGLGTRMQVLFEYLRAIRWELRMLHRPDRIQVCSGENARFLLSFRPELESRIDTDLRAGVDSSLYSPNFLGREPGTMLFVGSFRHLPNREAVDWFIRHVLPLVRARMPEARLVLVGSDPPPIHSLPNRGEGIELVGFVPDVRDALNKYAVFVCPILAGSGMRVKLLEAFAAGIPVVSTRIGAEGLAEVDGDVCALADDPAQFAASVVRLLQTPEEAQGLATRARRNVEEHFDMDVLTSRLVESYRRQVRAKRSGQQREAPRRQEPYPAGRQAR